MTNQMIAWNTLVPSPRNVRKVKADVAGLAASIAADGLLQNLVVAPREDGKFEVLAGERRRRAIGQLLKAKSWAKDQLIPCEVREQDDATGPVAGGEHAAHRHAPVRCFPSLRGSGGGGP
ncbi:ParB/Srx family N-terminal domain-containing protein [Phenylobacterium sp.]|uniref:ParB/Srx family N-terminal domain-containing protein n=1 Tax=Phenylobacterium sp. TaxID=1871053 RepID=UPI00374D3C28